MKHLKDLMNVWLRSRFGHPVENIRQVQAIVPKRLYRNFGNFCKAVPYTREERRYLRDSEGCGALSPYLLRDVDRSGNGLHSVRELQQYGTDNSVPARCNLCDFYKNGIPCPLYNTLKDGSVVCHTHRYIIIKQAPNV